MWFGQPAASYLAENVVQFYWSKGPHRYDSKEVILWLGHYHMLVVLADVVGGINVLSDVFS
jgi:hypothetical protein